MPKIQLKKAPKETTSRDLAKLLSPFKILCSKNALSARYKTLELGKSFVRGMSSYGLLEVKVELRLNSPCAVDANSFLYLLDSLPKDVLSLTANDGVLNWECGRASGKIALAVLEKPLPAFNGLLPESDIVKPWNVSDDFYTALTLGSLSCQGNNTLASVGMYGVVLDNTDGFKIYSSDTVTASCYSVAEKSINFGLQRGKIITLPPEGAIVLAEVCENTQGELYVFQDQIAYIAGGVNLIVKTAAPLRADTSKILKAYGEAEHAAMIQPDAIAAFIKRVELLSETKKNSHVNLTLNDGTIGLAFEEGLASSEESYLVEGLENVSDIPGILLSAEKLAKVLKHVNTIVLDYADREIISFYGLDGAFIYLVCGRKPV